MGSGLVHFSKPVGWMNIQFFAMNTVCLYTICVDLVKIVTIIHRNNTPPASRKNSAPRGVTRFWSLQKGYNLIWGLAL